MRSFATAWRLLPAVAVLSVAACGGNTVTDTPGPTTPVDTTKPPSTVQRASITARVSIDPLDASLAQQAGIGVSGLTVRLTSSRAGDPVRTAVTGADGTVQFDGLLEARYTADVVRTLTAGEVQRLSPADREASVFSGGAQVVLSPPTSRSIDVSLVGARRGSIVISEVFGNYGPYSTGTDNYFYGSYVEFYNNSDTTAYLDGLVFLSAMGWHRQSYAGSCSKSPWSARLDSAAVYAGNVMAFPGSGRDFPIRPGEGKVMAMDAINHMVAAPEKEQVDLSHAHFEQFWTDADTDNPESANMLRVYGSGSGVFGRGVPYINSGQHVLLSAAARAHIRSAIVPYTFSDGTSRQDEWARVPSEYILDLVAIEYSPLVPGYDVAQQTLPPCVPWTSPFYDRAPAPLQSTHERKSFARRSLGRTADGREILQRTKNSARDLELAEPLRRSLNK